MKRRAPLFRAAFAAITVTLALAQAGCEDEKKKETPASDAGPTTQPLLDGKLGEAVAAAGASAAAGKGAAKGNAAADGPPEKGFFEPGSADKAHARGAPPKVEILSDGNEPREALSAKIEPGA